jgi:hypothetical protein
MWVYVICEYIVYEDIAEEHNYGKYGIKKAINVYENIDNLTR